MRNVLLVVLLLVPTISFAAEPADEIEAILEDAKLSKAKRARAQRALEDIREDQAELDRLNQLRPVPAQRLAHPDHLTDEQRRALTQRMHAHAQGMNSLWWAVIFIDGEAAKKIGLNLKEGPFGTEDDEFAALLPSRFYTLKDELREEAKGLIEAAETAETEPEVLVRAYTRMLSTCVKCHAENRRDWGGSD